MPSAKALIFPVDIELPEPKVRFVCDQLNVSLSDGQKIAGLAQSALDDLSEGGMVVTGKVMEQIRNLVGDIQDDQDLVRFIEAGKGMEDGCVVGKWRPDPTYVTVLEEIARSQGNTVQQCVQNLMDWGISQGWGYQINPETVVMFFARDDFRMICEAFDKPHLTGTDLAAFIRGLYSPDREPVALLETGDERP